MHAMSLPAGSHSYTTIDAHTVGEPLRIIISGVPAIPGTSILEKRAFAEANLDGLRRILMWEPRGHADMYGAILTDPVTPDGDAGVLFLHNDGFSTMCGHGVIALVTVGVVSGMFGDNVVRLDTPAGRVTATAHVSGGVVESVSFVNVASFVVAQDLELAVPGLGTVTCDIAYGGAFYVYVNAVRLGLELSPVSSERIIDLGRRIKLAAGAAVEVGHPEGGADLGFLYGTIFVGPPEDPRHHSRNVCVFADGEVDRSPTGTGVSGRLALHHAKGELDAGETVEIESILGTTFSGRIVGSTEVGGVPAVLPEVTGSAWITGRHEFVVDPKDPLGSGFLLR